MTLFGICMVIRTLRARLKGAKNAACDLKKPQSVYVEPETTPQPKEQVAWRCVED